MTADQARNPEPRQPRVVDDPWVCNLCGQQLAAWYSNCNSSIHQGPDDPNGWRGIAVHLSISRFEEATQP